MAVLALLPILAWLSFSAWWFSRSAPRITFREALLAGALAAAAWLVLGAEFLSLFHAVTFPALLLWWLIPLLLGGYLLSRQHAGLSQLLHSRQRFISTQYLLLAIILFLLIWTALQAALAAPNTPDAVAYHLQRQVFWMQQRGVQHYSTSILRQVQMPPLAEFAGLHLMILTGSDHFHNFPQWTAYLLTMLAGSLIVHRYKGSKTAQLAAALWIAAIPMAFMQASSAKNDMIEALWNIVTLYFILFFDSRDPVRWTTPILIGIGFGAMALTKSAGIMFIPALALLLLFLLLRHHRRRALPVLLTIVAIAAAINAPHMLRNIHAFGSPAPNDPVMAGGDVVGNQIHTPQAILSNMIRTLGQHMTLPSDAWNAHLTNAVIAFHHLLGLDVNDPRTTYQLGLFTPYAWGQQYEDLATEPAQLALTLFLLIPALLLARRQLPARTGWLILLLVSADFVVFSAVLKYEFWHPRLVLAMPVLLAPLFGWAVTAPRFRFALIPATALLALAIVPSLNTFTRPLLGPNSLFTMSQDQSRYILTPMIQEPVDILTRTIADAKPASVAFETGWTSDLYVLQRSILDHVDPAPRFLSFNAAFLLPDRPEPDPDLLVAYTDARPFIHRSTGTPYTRIARVGPYVLYVNPHWKQSIPVAPPPSRPQ